MAQASLDKLAKALEQVEARLSKIEGLLAGGAGASAAPAAGGASVDAWDTLVSSHIPKFVADSKTIAEDVGQNVRRPKIGLGSFKRPDMVIVNGLRPSDTKDLLEVGCGV